MKFLLISVLILCFMVLGSVAQKNKQCGLPPSVYGTCRGNIPKWSYDSAKKKCVKFDYSGCKGNDNRFESEQECKQKCV